MFILEFASLLRLLIAAFAFRSMRCVDLTRILVLMDKPTQWIGMLMRLVTIQVLHIFPDQSNLSIPMLLRLFELN